MPVWRAALASWNWAMSTVLETGGRAGLQGDFLAGEKRAVLFRGEEPSLDGVAGFRGDLVGILTAGDLTGEQRRSSNCCEVTLLGLLVGNKLEAVGAVFTGVLEMGLEGDWNKFAAAFDAGCLDIELFTEALGEHNKSSSWLDVSSLGDFEGNSDLVGVGFRDLLTGVLVLTLGVFDFSGLSRRLHTSSALSLPGLLKSSAFDLLAFVSFLLDKLTFGLFKASLERPEQGLSPTGIFS